MNIRRILCWWKGSHDYGRARDREQGEHTDNLWAARRVKECKRCGRIVGVRARRKKDAA